MHSNFFPPLCNGIEFNFGSSFQSNEFHWMLMDDDDVESQVQCAGAHQVQSNVNRNDDRHFHQTFMPVNRLPDVVICLISTPIYSPFVFMLIFSWESLKPLEFFSIRSYKWNLERKRINQTRKIHAKKKRSAKSFIRKSIFLLTFSWYEYSMRFDWNAPQM